MSSNHGTVRASHILVKHRDSRRPSSWKEPTVTRSKVPCKSCSFGIWNLMYAISKKSTPAERIVAMQPQRQRLRPFQAFVIVRMYTH